MKVYAVYLADYDAYGAELIAVSIKDAIKALKESYQEPYIVTWTELCTDGLSITGKFEAVPRYSVEHIARYYIEEYELIDFS